MKISIDCVFSIMNKQIQITALITFPHAVIKHITPRKAAMKTVIVQQQRSAAQMSANTAYIKQTGTDEDIYILSVFLDKTIHANIMPLCR